MDRSLKFFLDVFNGVNKPKETDVTVSTTITTYNPDDPLSTVNNETKELTYKLINSNMSTNTYVNFDGNSNANEIQGLVIDENNVSNISISSIIKWSKKKSKAVALNPMIFAYLTDFNVYPANRLMILRRFNGPIGNDLFSLNSTPKVTLASYYDLENPPIKISFSEKWKKFDQSFMDVIQDLVGIKFDTIPGVKKSNGSSGNSGFSGDIMNLIGQKLGIISDGGMPYGDPNMIYEAKIRDVTGEGVSTGLESNIAIEFEAKYTAKYINGVNTRDAMRLLLARAIKMGTSPERFYITGKASTVLTKMLEAFSNGDFSKITDAIINGINDIMAKVTAVFSASPEQPKETDSKESKTAAITAKFDSVISSIQDAASTLIKNRFSRYKINLQGAISALAGLNTGHWHITLGNPKYPWLTIGNLIVDDVTLDVGGEMTYDDMFSELTVKIKLLTGRPLGAKGLSSIFNSGRGRIYDTPAKLSKAIVPVNTDVKFEGSPESNTDNNKNVETKNEENVKEADIGAATDFSNGTQQDKNL